MRVMAAGVHHPGFLAGPGGFHFRRKGQIDFLGHRQRVHVRAQCDDRTRLATLEQRHDAGVRHAGPDFEAKRPEVFGNDARSAEFAIAEFGIAVDVMPPFDHFGLDLVGQPVEIGPDVGRETAAGKNRQEGGDNAG